MSRDSSLPTQHSTTRWWLLGLVVVVPLVVVGIIAVLDDGGDSDAGSNRWSAVVTGLCETRRALQQGDVDEARRAFYDQSHDGLHLLAARAESVDRSTVARLLEVKNLVERELDGSGRGLVRPLEDLVDATGTLASALGQPAPRTCEPATTGSDTR